MRSCRYAGQGSLPEELKFQVNLSGAGGTDSPMAPCAPALALAEANAWQHGQAPQAVRVQAPGDCGAGAQGAAHDATAEAAQAPGNVVRVQSRPPAMGAKFETPRRTVKPFSELEVETLVDVRRARPVQSLLCWALLLCRCWPQFLDLSRQCLLQSLPSSGCSVVCFCAGTTWETSTAVACKSGVGWRQGVARYGVGRWREILTARELEGRFDPVRTGVDLKVSVRRCELTCLDAACLSSEHRSSMSVPAACKPAEPDLYYFFVVCSLPGLGSAAPEYHRAAPARVFTSCSQEQACV